MNATTTLITFLFVHNQHTNSKTDTYRSLTHRNIGTFLSVEFHVTNAEKEKIDEKHRYIRTSHLIKRLNIVPYMADRR